MDRLKHMKDSLMGIVEGQMGNLQSVDAKELGEAIDMIKDLEEAMYYCSITKAMEKQEKEEEFMKQHPELSRRHYGNGMMMPYYMDPYDIDRDLDRGMGRMYYTDRGSRRNQPRNEQGQFMEYYGGNGNSSSGGSSSGGRSGGSSNGGGNSRGSSSYYTETEFPFYTRDTREGRSPVTRRSYMESKEMHKDKSHKIKELEKYMQELSDDIVEMIADTSPEEKQILEKKMTHLTSKISQLSHDA